MTGQSATLSRGRGSPLAGLRQAAVSWGPFMGLVVLLACGWEVVKLIGGQVFTIGSFTWHPPLQLRFATDLNMPHLWDIAAAFFSPARRNGPPLIDGLWSASLFTLREAAVGFLLAVAIGLALGILLARSRLLEQAIVPYVIASQTVPIIAIAPMVVIWLNAGWLSVAVISAYLAVFPVTIAALRGLQAIDPQMHELLSSMAASNGQRLTKLELPAAVPYLFNGFKLAASVSVIGAIVGELPSGISDGLGGTILAFNQYYITDPSRLWATIIASGVLGLFAYFVVVVVEKIVTRGRYQALETVTQ